MVSDWLGFHTFRGCFLLWGSLSHPVHLCSAVLAYAIHLFFIFSILICVTLLWCYIHKVWCFHLFASPWVGWLVTPLWWVVLYWLCHDGHRPWHYHSTTRTRRYVQIPGSEWKGWDTALQNEKKIRKEYYPRIRMITKSELNAINRKEAINTPQL